MSKRGMMKNIKSHSSEISQMKQEIRKRFLRLRNEQDKNTALLKSRSICERLMQSQAFLDADIIFGYYPVRGEVDTTPILKESFRLKKRVALPRCLDKKGAMEFYEINSLDDQVPGAYNIPEPKEGLLRANVKEGLMLIPGVAFDLTCARLGYGGGYYDRFIKKSPSVRYVALAYEMQLSDLLPVEAHDEKVDMIVTEKRVIKKEEA